MSEAFIAGQIQNITQNISTSDVPFNRVICRFAVTATKVTESPTITILENYRYNTFGDFGIVTIRQFGYATSIGIGSGSSITTSTYEAIGLSTPMTVDKTVSKTVSPTSTAGDYTMNASFDLHFILEDNGSLTMYADGFSGNCTYQEKTRETTIYGYAYFTVL